MLGAYKKENLLKTTRLGYQTGELFNYKGKAIAFAERWEQIIFDSFKFLQLSKVILLWV